VLHWNTQPPNATNGFIPIWQAALEAAGVEIALGTHVDSIHRHTDGPDRLELRMGDGRSESTDAAFLAIPPPGLAQLLPASCDTIAEGFGHNRESLRTMLRDSVYEHLGMVWHFDSPLPTDLPLGGHNVRRGWHPILVQHAQYRPHLRRPATTVVLGSISLATDFRHHRLGTGTADHTPEELARILWEDERLVDPTLPEPADTVITGDSSATQIVHHGPLPIRAQSDEVYISTNLNGHAPYFTASLESAIQSGAAAAAAFDPGVERLPVGPAGPEPQHPWRG